MDTVDAALADLATSLALPSLALNDKGVVSLDIAGLGEVQLERWRNDGLLVSLFREGDADQAPRMLELCSLSENHPAPITACMDGKGRLGFVMRLHRGLVSHARIEQCLGHMTGLLEKL